MTINDFLKEHKQVLKVMAMEGLSVDLGRCAGMLEVYEAAKKEHGSRYAIELCKDRYCIRTRRRVYQILKVLKRALP
ncbi:MAG: hypothetical protein IKW41_06030 [Phascolarctobacterium sp.]|nr:hypothetical protein [Phascolarctobacterium sp.]